MAFNKAKALQEAENLVVQGKIPQAIKQYRVIVENEPADLNLLNTIGDLYVREKNIPRALEYFHKLADAYIREGFTVKAIAMYKKVTKLDSSSVEPVLKLAELYQLQGLGREAREQYVQAADFYKKRKQDDKVVEVLRAVVRLDPENATLRFQLGTFYEKAGLAADAAKTYVEVVEIALRHKDPATADSALKKAAALDASNPHVHLLEARLALSRQQATKAVKIITSVPELKNKPDGRRLLLEAYVGLRKLEEAQDLVSEVYRSNPADFSPLASFSALCIEKGNFDAALKLLSTFADELIAQKNTAPLMECLRRIWEKRPQDIPLLELICRVCERSGDEFALPEALEALGHAYVQAGEFGKAETAYRQLTEREPGNEHYRMLLKQILQKQGKEIITPESADLSNVEMALAEPEATAPSASEAGTAEAALVKDVFENSDLYFRYGLIDKAVAELEKVLSDYPDQIDVHRRIMEVCLQKQPARAGRAAKDLARIYNQRGDPARAKKYEDLARQAGVPIGRTEPSAAPAASQGPVPEVGLRPGILSGEEAPPAPQISATSAPQVALDPAMSATSAQVSASVPLTEFDLSADLEATIASAGRSSVAQEAPAFNLEEARIELNFYLDNGFVEEAQRSIQALEEKFPRNSQVAELRQLVEERAATAAAARERAPVPPGPTPAEPVPGAVLAAAGSKGGRLPTASGAPVPTKGPTVTEPPSASPAQESAEIVASAPPTEPVTAPSTDFMGSLVNDLEASLDGIEELAAPPSPAKAETAKVAPSEPASPLSGLLEEFGEAADQRAAEGDPETHYSLGVAFREMGLLDEAIGEFQKVLRGGQKDALSPHFLQACTLLALCFMDKKMPGIAAKWYLRALEAPGLDEEGLLALHYDLGVAYEQAGDTKTALDKFTEVYSQNIDYRDVAEKIRLLQQRVS